MVIPIHNKVDEEVDEESGVVIDTSVSTKCTCSCEDSAFTILFVLLASICMLPFIICDFYFAFANPITCQHDSSKFMKDLNLTIWLAVCASCGSVGYLYTVTLFCFFQANILKETKNKSLTKYFTALRYFSLIWLIVGSVLFWRDIEPQKNCSKSITNYLYTKLIWGFVSFFINERMEKSE